MAVLPHPRAVVLLSLATLAGLVSLAGVACGGSSSRKGFDENTDPSQPNPPPAPTSTGDFDKNKVPLPPAPSGEVNEVFGQSADTLFRLDPKTKAVTQVGLFNGCTQIIDIALDEASTLYAVSFTGLYVVDKLTAKCTPIATGSYPNSLSFVPKGTVDANAEALVGYEGGDYVRIDTKTGAKTKIGALGGGLVSSGDIVSVKGGKAYLTVKGTNACTANDCLVEVDPASGKLVKNWGSVEHTDVFGLAFWGGKVYGFDNLGELFEVTFGSAGITTTSIAIPSKPPGLSFWGAGSSTSAPLVPTTQ